MKSNLLDQVLRHYLQSGDFNGLGVIQLGVDAGQAEVRELIQNRNLDLVRGDGHPNPHIKALEAEPVEIQLEKIDAHGLEGCLYPTPEILVSRGAGDGVVAPYTKALCEGEPQLSFRVFDLRALEWYRNDPRFEFDVDDIHGRILLREGAQIAEKPLVRDGLEFFEFGFAYNNDLHRAVAAFLRYLHDLPQDQQLEMQKHELEGGYKLHPDFYRTQIIGDFPERISIFDAFLQEQAHINKMCELIGKPHLFRTAFDDYKRPHGFGILIRPTRKEFRDFALQLDQLLSDNLNHAFFAGDIELNRTLTDAAGNVVTQQIGTIQLLQEWLAAKFKLADPKPLEEMFSKIRTVRKARQKPAHVAEDNDFDQKYIAEQRDLMIKAFDAVRTLRMCLENHPYVRGYEIPNHLREGRVWTY